MADCRRRRGRLRLNRVVLTHDSPGDRYWIMFYPPAGASTRVQPMIETGGGHHHSGFDNAVELPRALKAFWPMSS